MVVNGVAWENVVEVFYTGLYLVIFSISLMLLISLGLAVIFGMMKVINLAHGEFMMVGGYTCVLTVNAGAPLWLGVLFGGLVTGVLGIIVERLVIRFLYGRIIDTLLATWGLSLLFVGAATTIFGASGMGISTEFTNVSIGGMNVSSYNLIVCAFSIALALLTWWLAVGTKVGLIVRGTMQVPEVASCLGVDRSKVYMATFGFGSCLAGLAGAALAPITGVSPAMGAFFIAKAFITVIVGGHLPLIGATAASSIFGAIDGVVSYIYSSVTGEVSMLIAAVLLLRLLPLGITGRMKKGM
ncbi:MAG: branched-chain amino acid ABC transporter permease [Burkholderiaceae bacterium]|nr:branched-chain amino acid ABC transporter permease [Burkholderiaceae bacterium]